MRRMFVFLVTSLIVTSFHLAHAQPAGGQSH
jgi:hypothetical protein